MPDCGINTKLTHIPKGEPVAQAQFMSYEDCERRKADDLARLDAMTDEDIDLSDMPEITDWSNAVRGLFSDSPQAEIRLRIDRDVILWILRWHGEYQTAINAALREHMERHRRAS